MAQFVCSAGVLKTLPIFSSMPETVLAAMVPSVQHRSYPARSIMMRAGETADGLCVILAGRARVSLSDPAGRESIVAMLGPHDLFGELGLVEGSARTADVYAQEACDVLHIPRRVLLECLRQDAAPALSLLSAITTRLSDAYRKIQALAIMDVHGRVAQLLLETARDTNGEWRVETGAEQIAAMVGASREMVSRVVAGMIRNGAVRRHKRKLIVLDRAALGERQSGGSATNRAEQSLAGSSRRRFSEGAALA